MPSISHHWVRLTDEQLVKIVDYMPDQEDEESDADYLTRLHAWGHRVVSLIEDGLETW